MKKKALDLQKADADFDTAIMKSFMMEENRDSVCASITENNQRGESVHFWLQQVQYPTVHFTLCEIISHYGEMFKEGTYMTDGEIKHIGNFLIDRFPYSFRYSELIYFMNKLTEGGYGKQFGNQMTAAIWFEKFNLYLEELSGKLEAEHLERKNVVRPSGDKLPDIFPEKFKRWTQSQK